MGGGGGGGGGQSLNHGDFVEVIAVQCNVSIAQMFWGEDSAKGEQHMNLLSDKVWISKVQVYPQWSKCIPPMKPPSPSTGSNSDAVSYEFPGTSMGGLHSKRCGRLLLGEYH